MIKRPGLAVNVSLEVNVTEISACWTGRRGLLKDEMLCVPAPAGQPRHDQQTQHIVSFQEDVIVLPEPGQDEA